MDTVVIRLGRSYTFAQMWKGLSLVPACLIDWLLKAKKAHYGTFPVVPQSFGFPNCTNRYALQLLAPASILATLAGRSQIEVEDIGEMNELFLDAKTSAAMIGSDGGFDGTRMR
jgi:TIP49 AAA-lid domain